jgi:hypothetical protein
MTEEPLQPDTKKVLTQGEELHNLVRSEGWQMAKRKLLSDVANFTNVLTLETKNRAVNDIIVEMAGRQLAAATVLDWIKDIEGSAEQYKVNTDTLREIREEGYIHREA